MTVGNPVRLIIQFMIPMFLGNVFQQFYNIVDSIVALGNKLGIKVIAEFVETQEEVDVLHSLGCSWYQGYLYSKPVSFEQFVSYLCRTNEELSGV